MTCALATCCDLSKLVGLLLCSTFEAAVCISGVASITVTVPIPRVCL